jgi:hypothetical protein
MTRDRRKVSRRPSARAIAADLLTLFILMGVGMIFTLMSATAFAG